MKTHYKGLILTLILSLIAMFLGQTIMPFMETITIGILLAMVIGNLITLPKDTLPGITYASKKLLKLGIILLGVQLNFSLIMNLGPKLLLLIVALITLALLASAWIGKVAGLNPKLAILLGVGSSICGASAIVAMGPVVEAEEEDMTLSVTIISILGAIGVLVYTLLGNLLDLSDLQYGVWSGSSLQGVAHAIAAASARGTDSLSLEIGTMVKMARVALLAPVAIVLGSVYAKSANKKRAAFPMYILWFILVGLLFTLNTTYSLIPMTYTLGSMTIDCIAMIKAISHYCILMAMVAMGLKVKFRNLEAGALRALRVCLSVFILLSLISLLFVHLTL